jgi:hypothetical protein
MGRAEGGGVVLSGVVVLGCALPPPPHPPNPAGWRQVPDRRSDYYYDNHGIYVPGRPFAIFIQVSNRGRNGCIKSWFCQYISLPTKYTVSDSILQYKVGLTLSFLSLISRGVGPFQNCITSL